MMLPKDRYTVYQPLDARRYACLHAASPLKKLADTRYEGGQISPPIMDLPRLDCPCFSCVTFDSIVLSDLQFEIEKEAMGVQKGCEMTAMRCRVYGFAVSLLIPFSGIASSSAEAAFNTLYSFCGDISCTPDGQYPYGGLTADGTGAYFGTTQLGTPNGPNGTVFKLSPPATPGGGWTLETLHAFTGGRDGSLPMGRVILDGSGALYGTTAGGGANVAGVVFKLTPPASAGGTWTESVIHNFAGADGEFPNGDLTFDSSGILYGTTLGGGSGGLGSGFGTVFKLTPLSNGAWQYSNLISFSTDPPTGGYYPMAGVAVARSGVIYGATTGGGTGPCFDGNGCGAVFELVPQQDGSYTERVLYSFQGGTDGESPMGTPVIDKSGNLYGTANKAGGGGGSVFRLKFTGKKKKPKFSVLYGFSGGPDGGSPESGLIIDASGNIYGTTEAGGSANAGTIFVLNPVGGGSYAEAVLYSFTCGADQGFPYAGLLQDSSGTLYGTTLGGPNTAFPCSNNSVGTVFALSQ